jgi:excisionase family DNA binding protein
MTIEVKNEKFYKTIEVAELMKVSVETVNRWRQEGKLKAHRISQRKYIFSETEIGKFLGGE